MKSNTSPSRSTSFNEILENTILLVLVTFLLGTAAIQGSKIHFTTAEQSLKTATSCTKTGVLRSLHRSFIKPYLTAWKKITPHASSWFSVDNLESFNKSRINSSSHPFYQPFNLPVIPYFAFKR